MHRMNARKLACVLLLALRPAGLRAQGQVASVSTGTRVAPPDIAPWTARAIHAMRAPSIDGAESDEAWRLAPVITDFRTFDPVENGEPKFRTEARVAYDARNVYVFVRAFDPHPDSITPLLSRRDVRTQSDQIKVMIDSYHDRRTGYEFAVNPAGVKRDYYTYDDSREDVSWDAVWDVATRIDSLGWTAEFRIPLSQLRYPRANSNTFGLMILRDVARTAERVAWPDYRRSRGTISSQFGELAGFEGLAAPRRVELVPYALARNVTTAVAAGSGHANDVNFGGDAKIGLGPSLTLDATVNPDFGQVEADPAVLNLTAFETFLAEQRPFFIEGTGIFGFGGDRTRLFYSRRVGRAPQLSGLVSNPEARVPAATEIIGAGKLSGRFGNGRSIGALAAVTAREVVSGTTVEPRTTIGVGRFAQDFRKGQSSIGAMITALSRDLDATTESFLRRQAVTGGIDARHQLAGGAWRLRASAAGSMVEGSAAAIARTQRNSVHYFNRPDDELVYDPTRTSLSGTSLNLSADKVSGTMTGRMSYERLGPGLETNDLGFLSRADQQTLGGYVFANSWKPRNFWKRADIGLEGSAQWTADGSLLQYDYLQLNLDAETPGGHSLGLYAWSDNIVPAMCDRCARGGPAVRIPPSWNVLTNLQWDQRASVSPYLAAIYSVTDEGRSWLWRVRPYVRMRAGSRMNAELGTRYQVNVDDWQWYTTAGVVGNDTTHYVFARLDQRLLSFTSRLDVTMSPMLSLQLYAEPFVAAGSYSNLRQLSSTPRADDYASRFRPYATSGTPGGFNEKEWHSNAVLRWEYRPGSTLFFVWQQGRLQDDRDVGSFAARRDYRNLFQAKPDNTFLIKGSYWLSL